MADSDQIQKYKRLTQMVTQDITKIRNTGQDIKRMADQLGTTQESAELRERLKERQRYTKELIEKTTKNIKEVDALPKPTQTSEKHSRKVQRDRLIGDFEKTLKEYQEVQKEVAAKERSSIAIARSASESADDTDPLGNSLQMQEQSLLTNQEMEDIRERQEELKKLENDIMTVNEIFKDLATMVGEQGEVIESIEANVTNAGENAAAAVKQLNQANTSAKSRRKKIIICSVIGIVLLIVIILIIVFTA